MEISSESCFMPSLILNISSPISEGNEVFVVCVCSSVQRLFSSARYFNFFRIIFEHFGVFLVQFDYATEKNAE